MENPFIRFCFVLWILMASFNNENEAKPDAICMPADQVVYRTILTRSWNCITFDLRWMPTSLRIFHCVNSTAGNKFLILGIVHNKHSILKLYPFMLRERRAMYSENEEQKIQNDKAYFFISFQGQIWHKVKFKRRLLSYCHAESS